jgi:hypothetical protein
MKAEVGNKVIAVTKQGERQGTVIKERINRNTKKPQYKVNIDLDGKGVEVDYNFWFSDEQLTVVVPKKGKLETVTGFVKNIFKRNK